MVLATEHDAAHRALAGVVVERYRRVAQEAHEAGQSAAV